MSLRNFIFVGIAALFAMSAFAEPCLNFHLNGSREFVGALAEEDMPFPVPQETLMGKNIFDVLELSPEDKSEWTQAFLLSWLGKETRSLTYKLSGVAYKAVVSPFLTREGRVQYFAKVTYAQGVPKL